jgi:hypothetical protein
MVANTQMIFAWGGSWSVASALFLVRRQRLPFGL